MVDKPQSNDAVPAPVPGLTPDAITPGVPRRGPGHRGADMRDTVAEMAERAQLISQEAGTKVAAAMKDVISAAAGIAGFAVESARDLVQYMVKRGQMTPEEADKLIRDVEAAHDKRPASEKGRPTATKIAADRAAVAKAEAAAKAAALAASMPPFRPAVRPAPPIPAPVVAPVPAKAAPAKAAPSKPATPASPKATAKAPSKPAKPAPSAAKPSKPAAKSAKPAAKSTAKPAKPGKSSKPAAAAKPKGGKR
jgi:polyhydroxyalkanoate synthesis regulator phasin